MVVNFSCVCNRQASLNSQMSSQRWTFSLAWVAYIHVLMCSLAAMKLSLFWRRKTFASPVGNVSFLPLSSIGGIKLSTDVSVGLTRRYVC